MTLENCDLAALRKALKLLTFYEVTLVVAKVENLSWFDSPGGERRHYRDEPDFRIKFLEYCNLKSWKWQSKHYEYFYGRAGPNQTFFRKPDQIDLTDRRARFLQLMQKDRLHMLPEVGGYILGQIANEGTEDTHFSWWAPVTAKEKLCIEVVRGSVRFSAGKLENKLTENLNGVPDKTLFLLAKEILSRLEPAPTTEA